MSTQQAEKGAWTQTQKFLHIPLSDDEKPGWGRRPNVRAQPFLIFGWPLLASHTELCGGISKVEGRVGGEMKIFCWIFLCESSKRNRHYGRIKGYEQCSGASWAWAGPPLRDSKFLRTQATWLHGRQTHLTTHDKSRSSLCPVEFWIPIIFSIFQYLQNKQLWIWNRHLPKNIVFVLSDMQDWELLCERLAGLSWSGFPWMQGMSGLRGNLRNYQ